MCKNGTRLVVMLCGLGLTGNLAWAGEVAAEAPAVDGPVMFLRAAAEAVTPGQRVQVEVFVNSVEDLGVFQVQLTSKEGRHQGRLEIVESRVEKTRDDFALGQSQIIAAADQKNMRAGALRMSGGVDIEQPRYLATFVLLASKDARGTFDVSVKIGTESFLSDSNSVSIPFQVGAPIQITVSESAPKPSRKR